MKVGLIFTMKEEEIMNKITKNDQIDGNLEDITKNNEAIDAGGEVNSPDLNQKRPKSQKAGLNAVRPDDYVERTFKDLAKDKGKSQTELFEAMFWNYINKEKEEEMEMALSYKSEINLISGDLDNILNHFKAITEKAQNTIIAERNNANQRIQNLQKDLETSELKNKELIEKNTEILASNETFTVIKEDLGQVIDKLKKELEAKDDELFALQKLAEENTIVNSKNSAKIMELEATLKEKELDLRETKESLHKQTLNTELESERRTRLELDIMNLKQELRDLKENHKEEMASLEKALILKYEAEKNMAIVDIKLQLIDIKNELQEKLLLINTLEKNQCQTSEK
jgi:hypothetical protein